MGFMAAVGVGTVPALLLTAKLARTVGVKSWLILYKSGSVLIIVAGVFFIVKAVGY